MRRHRLASWLVAGLAALSSIAMSAVGCIGPAARQDHHRHLRPAVARRVPAAADQGAEVRRGQQSRHHLRGAPAGCLRRPVQLRRVQGRRQRLADDASGLPTCAASRSATCSTCSTSGAPSSPTRPRSRRSRTWRAASSPPRARTTNYIMFEWLAKRQGVDVSKIQVVNTATPGLIGFALADRADAVQLWEPAYTILISKKPSIRTLDDGTEATWKAFSGGGSRIPYLGVAAHTDWIEQNKALIPRLYKAYEQAAKWLTANPDAAAKLISPKSTAERPCGAGGVDPGQQPSRAWRFRPRPRSARRSRRSTRRVSTPPSCRNCRPMRPSTAGR